MDPLLDSKKVPLLVQENSKTNLEFMQFWAHQFYTIDKYYIVCVLRLVENLEGKVNKEKIV